MGFNPFSRGQKSSMDGKQPFEPTDAELELIGRFGGANRLLFTDVKREIVEAGVVEGRRDLLWEAIRESRAAHEAHRSGGAERGR